MRVAVQVGGATVRIARAGAAPELIAELPGDVLHEPGDLLRVLASVVGPAPVEVVLVHPASWSADRVATWPGHPVAVPVAAAGLARRIVLDAGHSATDVTLVHGGRVAVHRRSRVGGAALDAAVAELLGHGSADARPVRELLSLHSEAGGLDAERLRIVLTPLLCEIVRVLRVVHGAGAAPVLLIGGISRWPLLAELLDAAGFPDVEVAHRPDVAAVLAALAFPIVNLPRDAGPAGLSGAEPVVRMLPVPPSARRRPSRVVGGGLVVAGVAAALLAAGPLVPRPGADAAVVPAGVLVQYGYRFDVPAGWEHSGGLPERRRSLLTPVATPEGSDLIAVERTPLGYDVTAEPERARVELRATYDASVAAGSALSDYAPATVAGRAVTGYLQRDGAEVVDWFVVLDADSQLSVGCRHTTAGVRAVRAACSVVVGSVRTD